MTIDELQKATNKTNLEIEQVKLELEACTDHRQERAMKRRLKELQYLQLWHLDLVQNLLSK